MTTFAPSKKPMTLCPSCQSIFTGTLPPTCPTCGAALGTSIGANPVSYTHLTLPTSDLV